MSLLLSSDGQILGITGLLLPWVLRPQGLTRPRGHPQVPHRLVLPTNVWAQEACLHEAGARAIHEQWQCSWRPGWTWQALGVGEGRVTLDWRWACHLEVGTEVWKWPEAAGSRRE